MEKKSRKYELNDFVFEGDFHWTKLEKGKDCANNYGMVTKSEQSNVKPGNIDCLLSKAHSKTWQVGPSLWGIKLGAQFFNMTYKTIF